MLYDRSRVSNGGTEAADADLLYGHHFPEASVPARLTGRVAYGGVGVPTTAPLLSLAVSAVMPSRLLMVCGMIGLRDAGGSAGCWWQQLLLLWWLLMRAVGSPAVAVGLPYPLQADLSKHRMLQCMM